MSAIRAAASAAEVSTVVPSVPGSAREPGPRLLPVVGGRATCADRVGTSRQRPQPGSCQMEIIPAWEGIEASAVLNRSDLNQAVVADPCRKPNPCVRDSVFRSIGAGARSWRRRGRARSLGSWLPSPERVRLHPAACRMIHPSCRRIRHRWRRSSRDGRRTRSSISPERQGQACQRSQGSLGETSPQVMSFSSAGWRR
jgi:hypothetical protein